MRERRQGEEGAMRNRIGWRLVLAAAWLAFVGPASADRDGGGFAPIERPMLEVEARFRLGALPLDRLAQLEVTVRNTGRAEARRAVVEVFPPARGFVERTPRPLATAHVGPVAPGASVRRTVEVDVRGLRPGTACFPVRVRIQRRSAGGGEEGGGGLFVVEADGEGRTRACVDLRPSVTDVTGGSGPVGSGESAVEVVSVTVPGARERALDGSPVVDGSGLRVRVRIEARRVQGGPVPPLEVEVVETAPGGAPRVAARYRTPPLMVVRAWDEREVAVSPGGIGPRCYSVRVRPASGVRVLPRAEPACVVVGPPVADVTEGVRMLVVPRGAAPEVRPGTVAGRVRAGDPVALDLVAANRGGTRSPAMTVAVTTTEIARAVLLGTGADGGEVVRLSLPALAPGEVRRVPFEFRFAFGGERRCLVPLLRIRAPRGEIPTFPLCYAVEGPPREAATDTPRAPDCPLGAPPSACRGPARTYRLHDGAVVDALRLAVRALGVEPAGRGRQRVRAEVRVWTTGADPVEGVTVEVLPPLPHGGLLHSLRLDGPVRPRVAARALTLAFEVPVERMGCLRVRAFGEISVAGRRLPAKTRTRQLCVRPRIQLPPDAIDPVRVIEAMRGQRLRIERVRLAEGRADSRGVRYEAVRIRVALPRGTTSIPSKRFELGVRGRDGRVRPALTDWLGRLAGRSGRPRNGYLDGVVRIPRDAVRYGECAVVRLEGGAWPPPGRSDHPGAACLPEPPHMFIEASVTGFYGARLPRGVRRVRACVSAWADGTTGRPRTCSGRLYDVRRRPPVIGVSVVAMVPRGKALNLRAWLEDAGGRTLAEVRRRFTGSPLDYGGTLSDRSPIGWKLSHAWGPGARRPSASRGGRRPPAGLGVDPEVLRRALGR